MKETFAAFSLLFLCCTPPPDQTFNCFSPDSAVFVNDVFDAIRYKLYLPGAVRPPKPAPMQMAPVAQPLNSLPYDDGPSVSMPAPLPQSSFRQGSRKRSYNDLGDASAPPSQDPRNPYNRVFKQPRRGGGPGGRGGRMDKPNGYRGPEFVAYPQGGYALPPLPLDMNAAQDFNPKEALEALYQMQQSMGLAGVPGPTAALHDRGARFGNQTPKKKRGRCRDYDRNGFCARGISCPFEHGDNSIYVPPAQPGSTVLSVPQPQNGEGKQNTAVRRCASTYQRTGLVANFAQNMIRASQIQCLVHSTGKALFPSFSCPA